MLKVAMLSGWHVHAKDYANRYPKLKMQLYQLFGMRTLKEAGHGQMNWVYPLKRSSAGIEPDDVDAVIVDAPTNMHTEVMIAAANAGKHIFTEKVMALTVAECEAIAEAVRKAE